MRKQELKHALQKKQRKMLKNKLKKFEKDTTL